MSNRKSFILYCDLLSVLDELSDEQAGKLFKAIKAYHRSDPEGRDTQDCDALESLLSNFVIRIAFQPFRAAFERDQEKYNSMLERNKANGRKGGRPASETKTQKTQSVFEKPKKPSGFSENPQKPTKTQWVYNDNVNDNVNDNDNTVPPAGVTCQGQAPDAVPFNLILDFWNKAMDGKAISKVHAIKSNTKRGGNVRARFNEYGIEKIYQAIMNVANSDFLNGRNSRNFIADIDWVFLPSNFLKVLDNNYRNRTTSQNEATATYRSTTEEERQQREREIAYIIGNEIGRERPQSSEYRAEELV